MNHKAHRIAVKEFLIQSRGLHHLIQFNRKRLKDLESELPSLPALQIQPDKVQVSPSGDAYFVRTMEQIVELREELEREIALASQINDTICTVPPGKSRMVLLYRYQYSKTWSQIAAEMHADNSTVRRWANDALNEVILPDDPIMLSA